MSKQGGGTTTQTKTQTITKSTTGSDEGKSPKSKLKTRKTQRDEIPEQSNGENDLLRLPSDYSAERGRKERAPLLPDTKKQPKRGCYSSEIENYRIPSIAIIISLAIESCGYLALSAVLFFKSRWLPAGYLVAATLCTLIIFAIELRRFIATYALKTIKTGDDWKWDESTRLFHICYHVLRILFVLGVPIIILVVENLDQNTTAIVLASLAVCLGLSTLPIIALAWPKKRNEEKRNEP